MSIRNETKLAEKDISLDLEKHAMPTMFSYRYAYRLGYDKCLSFIPKNNEELREKIAKKFCLFKGRLCVNNEEYRFADEILSLIPPLLNKQVEEIFAEIREGLIAIRKFKAHQLDEHMINNPKDRQAKKEHKIYVNALQDFIDYLYTLKDKYKGEK